MQGLHSTFALFWPPEKVRVRQPLRLEHTPPLGSGAFMSRNKDCSEIACRQSVASVPDFLNHVAQGIRWSERMNCFIHCLHFPYFITHFMDSMSIGRMRCVDLWNPKYAVSSKVRNWFYKLIEKSD